MENGGGMENGGKNGMEMRAEMVWRLGMGVEIVWKMGIEMVWKMGVEMVWKMGVGMVWRMGVGSASEIGFLKGGQAR